MSQRSATVTRNTLESQITVTVNLDAWNKLSKKAHAAVMWLVAIGGNISALWILIANSFMQQRDVVHVVIHRRNKRGRDRLLVHGDTERRPVQQPANQHRVSISNRASP